MANGGRGMRRYGLTVTLIDCDSPYAHTFIHPSTQPLSDIHIAVIIYSLLAVARGWRPEVLERAAGCQPKRWNFNLVRDTCGQAVTEQSLASDCPL